MPRTKGKVQQNLAIDPVLKEDFHRLCRDKGVNVTAAVSCWMQACVDRNELIAQPKAITTNPDGSLPPEFQQAMDKLQYKIVDAIGQLEIRNKE